jgi:outer membrane protein assembly factor BamE (lipoprotein component of BamABCDE complex)
MRRPAPTRRRARRPAELLAAALLLGAALATGGCSITHTTAGRELPATSALEPGRTTKAQALVLLGAPLSVRRQFDGDLLLWSRREAHGTRLSLVPFLPLYERSDGHAEEDVLALLFDHDGVLVGFGVQRDIGP